MDLSGKIIMLGMTGSIAAYKGADLCSRLVRAGAEVRVLMTPSAARMVGPSTFEGLTHRPPAVDLFAADDTWENVLERSAHPADLYIVAPCTAGSLARIAAGMASDFVCAAALAATCPVLIAPAMATPMWENPRTRRNVESLQRDGVHWVGPAEGRLASGRVGLGRMAEPGDILEAAHAILLGKDGSGARRRDLEGERVLVTAGPTQEALDPVRMITNRSTGRMGIAVAAAAAARGADVTLVLGPTHLPDPEHVRTVRVTTAEQMRDEALACYEGATIVVATAAVSDYRPARAERHKVKKTEGPASLALERTPDILAEMGRRKRPGQVLIGFAAETQDVEANAREKLNAKNLDAVVANDITQEGSGFGVETNAALLVTRDGVADWPRVPKAEMAHAILDEALRLKGGVDG
jgi:phosphopantothenoylcysteine decarboxylase / phosphopantothenate---cysteine ligase